MASVRADDDPTGGDRRLRAPSPSALCSSRRGARTAQPPQSLDRRGGRGAGVGGLPLSGDPRCGPRRRVADPAGRAAGPAARRRGVHGSRLLAPGRALAANRPYRREPDTLCRDGRLRGRSQQRAAGQGRRPATRALGLPRRVLVRARHRDRRVRPWVRSRHPRPVPPRDPPARHGRGVGRPHRDRLADRDRHPCGRDPRRSLLHAAAPRGEAPPRPRPPFRT